MSASAASATKKTTWMLRLQPSNGSTINAVATAGGGTGQANAFERAPSVRPVPTRPSATAKPSIRLTTMACAASWSALVLMTGAGNTAASTTRYSREANSPLASSTQGPSSTTATVTVTAMPAASTPASDQFGAGSV